MSLDKDIIAQEVTKIYSTKSGNMGEKKMKGKEMKDEKIEGLVDGFVMGFCIGAIVMALIIVFG